MFPWLCSQLDDLGPNIPGVEPEPEVEGKKKKETEEERAARKKKEKKAKKKAEEAAALKEAQAGGALNLADKDPFADDKEVAAGGSKDEGYIHIRVQKRNGRKCITTISGLDPKIDCKKLVKHFTKELSCSGNITADEQFGEVIQVQGDQRMKIAEFFVDQKIAKKSNIKVHGF